MRTLLIFAILLFSLQTSFSQNLNPVTWEFSSKKVGENEYDLTYTANIQSGWYVYSQYLEGDDGPIPTSFNYEGGDHYEMAGKNIESEANRKEGHDPMFDMNIVKYSKKAVFTQRVKIKDASKPITGYLEYMTCDDTRCLPPKEVDYSFDLNIQPDESTGATEPTKEEAYSNSSPAEEVVVSEIEPEESDNGGLLNPVKWSWESKKVNEEEFDLVYTAKIQDGWYVYTQYIEGEDGPIPTSFNYLSDNFEAVGENEETSEHRKEGFDKMFEMNIVKYSKEVSFTQRVKAKDISKAIEGYLEYMTCDDTRCLPPKEVDFSFNLSGETVAEEVVISNNSNKKFDTKGTPLDANFNHDLAKSDCGTEEAPKEENDNNFWLIFLLGFGGGLVALLTPCVFPMIPLTVSFFTNSSKDRASGIRNALTYGASIIVIYVLLGMLITGIFGADSLNVLSTNAWFNIFFAVLFIVFAFSFFGYFEITLPSSWSNKTDQAADKGGLIGIFFMAFTLSLVSFSCTGPIIGTLLVETATGGSEAALFGRIPLGPLVGMFGFSVALALPFGLFAAFPSWLNSLPKSGGWMTSVKVTLGFIEIALALKFLSIADLTMGWKIMPYEAFVGLWVLCALGLAAYYMGWIRFPHDGPAKSVSNTKKILAGSMVAFALYLASGFQYSDRSETFVTPNLLSGLAPPAGHSYIYPKKCPLNINCFKDYYEGLAHAKKVGKPILLDFTGHGCVNCRRMEDQVWGEAGVFELIRDDYVLVSLYVDERKKLDETYISPIDGRERRSVGHRWADFQLVHFSAQAQPYYILLDNDETVLNKPRAYTPDKDEYQAFLECGLERFEDKQRKVLGSK
ncbi:MAG: protein-disulfide reductase DsbD family protein [Saprospiraceae bacterium]|nr:protein-disulfide reductase DsbD family protein [Saprospiraceae bacterium]